MRTPNVVRDELRAVLEQMHVLRAARVTEGLRALRLTAEMLERELTWLRYKRWDVC